MHYLHKLHTWEIVCIHLQAQMFHVQNYWTDLVKFGIVESTLRVVS
jgi:hypothetical protein